MFRSEIFFFSVEELRLPFCNTVFEHKRQKCTSTHVLNKVKSFHVRSKHASIIC